MATATMTAPAVMAAPSRLAGEVAEGARSEVGVSPSAAVEPQPDPEVVAKPVRRRFPAKEKLRILREADRCREPGQLGALLRREGLYSSHLTEWRRQREAGALAALAPKKRGRPAQGPPWTRRMAELERENERLRTRLEQAEAIIEVQKKVSALLGIPLSRPDSNERV